MSRIVSTSDRRGDPAGAAPGIAHIGCSGWHYKSWRGVVYPEELPTIEWLRAYTRRFHTVRRGPRRGAAADGTADACARGLDGGRSPDNRRNTEFIR
jgi:hypothetical protein